MRQSDSPSIHKNKRQKQEKYETTRINYKLSDATLSVKAAVEKNTSTIAQNKNVVHSIATSQINGRYERRGNQLITNKINDKGFSYSSNLIGHWGCVNALDFSHGDGKYLCSGSDDKRVLIWELFSPKPAPIVSLHGHLSNIFSTIFTHSNRFILSCGNDDSIIRYDIEKPPNFNGKELSISPLQIFTRHGAAVYKVSALPESDEIFASASEDASIRLWDARAGTAPIGLIPGVSPYQGVDFHPHGTYFVTANTTYGVELWDIRSISEKTFRRPKSVVAYDTCGHKDVTTAVFNKRGDKLVATVRKVFPMVFETHSAIPHSVYYDPNYRNKCTMKSCVFMGANDEYVIGGSDNFNLYIWEVPTSEDEFSGNSKAEEMLKGKHLGIIQNDKPKQVLAGHRSIVNNVKYHPCFPILASSGVEKLIKLWSPFPIADDAPTQTTSRPLFKNSDYAALFQDFDFIDRGSDDECNTEESSKTLALFDFFNQYEASSSDDNWEDEEEESENEEEEEEEEDLETHTP